MSRKDDLRRQREGTVINLTALQQESDLGRALRRVEKKIQANFNVSLHHEKTWKLAELVEALEGQFPDVQFSKPHNPGSYMHPDGGILSIVDNAGGRHPILISEVKNQGTNDKRIEEGLDPQSKGNAIERLAKNVIGIRTAMRAEHILPFVCFGYGCDFEVGSSILDRVLIVAMFGPLNETVRAPHDRLLARPPRTTSWDL
jgi:type II restriction enzyme